MKSSKPKNMYSYSLLEPSCYYLIQEKENEEIFPIKVNFETDFCMFVSKYSKDGLSFEWNRKTDNIFEILEMLDDAKVKEWEEIYMKTSIGFEQDDDE